MVFVNRYFHPDYSATSQLVSDLAFELAASGSTVHVITSRQRKVYDRFIGDARSQACRMRLTIEAKQIIRETAREIFGADADVRLFGSRIDDAATGGDLDLLVVSGETVPNRERKILRFVARLQMRLGEQPIDVLVVDPTTMCQPIHEQALRQGVSL
jgi:hypothetical protein